MNVSINSELYTFISSFISGILCSVIFDFFRASRKGRKSNVTIIGAADILFWMLSCIICFGCIYFFGNGKPRFYIFAAIFIGSFLYFLLFSSVVNSIFVYIFKIIEFIFKILLTPAHFLYKILLRISISFKRKCGKFYEYIKNCKKRKKVKSCNKCNVIL